MLSGIMILMKIAPSILDADFGNLQTEIDSISACDRVHLDVMDGHYVPNLSFGVPVLKHIDFRGKPFEAHLMVNNPEEFFPTFLELGVMGITFHIENTGQEKALELLEDLRSCGVKAGICLDGYTDPDFLSDEILAAADQILLMSIKAGFGGQKLISEKLLKAKALRARGYKKEIEVDGGVNADNIAEVAAAGIDIAVVGSFIMKKPAENRADIIKNLQAA